jgi:hypothetical protein
MSSIVVKVPEDYEGQILINIIPTKKKPTVEAVTVEEVAQPTQKKSRPKRKPIEESREKKESYPNKVRETWKTQPRGPNGCFIPRS